MKKTQLKELIKQSMLELNNPKSMGAMTPDEEKMVSDYEEEEANKYALDSENPLDEARISPDSRVKHLAQSLEYVWNMGKGNNTTDYTSMAQSLIDDMFSENPLDENMDSIPEDIKWHWNGEVYDRVDYHSGDIGLDGYSESTKRDYTASATADYNGDDWEWSDYDIENIEVVPVKEIKNKPTHLRERKEPLSKLIRKADRIVEAWNSKKLIKEEMHGGYLELLEMNPNFEEGVANLLEAWNEWKEGPMTEPYMVEEAKQDVLAYLSSMMK